jgi:serine/threonine-protein kinase RsbW
MEFTDAALEPFGQTILEMTLPSQLSMKTPLVFRIVKELKGHGCLPWTGSPRAELCFDEAVTNAMVHGNRLDPARKVKVIVCADDERWGVIVEDQGEGFGAEDVPDPEAPDFVLRESGRGVLLMDKWLDSLRYNRNTRRLMMTRKRQEEPEEVESISAIEPEEGAEGPLEAVECVEIKGIPVVRVNSDRIQEDNIAALREAAAEALADTDRLVIDLSRVSYISSVGLSTMVGIYKSAKAKGGRVVLAGLQPSIKEILESSHLARLFTAAADVDKGIDELR